jgi:hypothetical protein
MPVGSDGRLQSVGRRSQDRGRCRRWISRHGHRALDDLQQERIVASQRDVLQSLGARTGPYGPNQENCKGPTVEKIYTCFRTEFWPLCSAWHLDAVRARPASFEQGAVNVGAMCYGIGIAVALTRCLSSRVPITVLPLRVSILSGRPMNTGPPAHAIGGAGETAMPSPARGWRRALS